MFSRNVSNVMISKNFVLTKLKCSPNLYPQMLEESFPHVLDRVVKLWTTPDVENYLNDLLKPNGSGGRLERQGFPQKAWYEILQLLEFYQESTVPDKHAR